jgi:hypothetical protein
MSSDAKVLAEIVRPHARQVLRLHEVVELAADVAFVERRSNRAGERVARQLPS